MATVQVYLKRRVAVEFIGGKVLNDVGAVVVIIHSNRGQGENDGIFLGVSGPLSIHYRLTSCDQSNCSSYHMCVCVVYYCRNA